METEEARYKYTKAYFKILDLITSNPEEDVFVIRGGQGASKTVSIIQLLIQALLSSEKEAAVVSSELSKMKRTVIRDYKKICKDWGVMASESEFNRSESKHEYSNSSYIDFLGADVNDIGKGFRRDILYINEADKMEVDTAVQFISRASLTIIDYNPDKLFWGDEYINENNFITLTFEDNEYLSDSEVRSIQDYKTKGFYNPDLPKEELFNESNIKAKYWANKWRVYGLGLVGALHGVVFDNWTEIDTVPKGARLLGYGQDFGYTNDPASLVGLYKYNNEIIYDEVIYSTGLLNTDLSDRYAENGVKSYEEIIADSAEPKSIEELNRYGWRVYACTKGPDSINYGINLMQQQPFKVTSRSKNLKKELQLYTWDADKSGNTLNKPVDKWNHAIDAARYAAMHYLGNKTTSSPTSVMGYTKKRRR